jgi:hypothetical protein
MLFYKIFNVVTGVASLQFGNQQVIWIFEMLWYSRQYTACQIDPQAVSGNVTTKSKIRDTYYKSLMTLYSIFTSKLVFRV